MVDITFPTAADIVTSSQNMIGEVAGPGVQLFTEDIMLANLGRIFDMVFIKRPWENYIAWNIYTLDGVNGLLTDPNPYGAVRGIEDFIVFTREGETQPLPLGNNKVSPFWMSGTRVQEWRYLPWNHTDYVKKRIQFWPKTSTGNIISCTRLHPGVILPSTKFYLDRQLLEMGLSWITLDSDATNVGAADTFKQMFDLRYRDLTKSLANHPMHISGDAGIPMQWFEQ